MRNGTLDELGSRSLQQKCKDLCGVAEIGFQPLGVQQSVTAGESPHSSATDLQVDLRLRVRQGFPRTLQRAVAGPAKRRTGLHQSVAPSL